MPGDRTRGKERPLPLFTKTPQEHDRPLIERRIGHGPPPPRHVRSKSIPDEMLLQASSEQRERVARLAADYARALHGALGDPYYLREGFLLYSVDCRRMLEALPASSVPVHLTLTSPPYNIGKEYERPLPLEEYVAWSQQWITDVWHATASGGSFWLNLGYVPTPRGRAVPLAYLLWDRSPFFLQQEVVWNYGAGVSTTRSFCPRNEKWLFFTKDPKEYTFNLDAVRDPNVKYPNQKKNGKYRCNPLGKNPSDVWVIPKVTTGEKRSSRERVSHPTQFPLRLVDRVVKVSSNPGDVIADPFAGSGSAGIAAVADGRVFIGSELNPRYCATARARFDAFLQLRSERISQMHIGFAGSRRQQSD